MSISNRIIFLIAGLAAAYFLVIAGDALHQTALTAKQPGDVGFAIVLCSIIALILGGGGWSHALSVQLEMDSGMDLAPELVPTCASVGFAGFCFLFGLIAAPVTASGYQPWLWLNAWSFIPILGMVPLTITFKDLVADCIQYRRNVREAKAKVVPLPLRKTDR